LECLATREYRVSIDLVRDEVETELQKVGTVGCCGGWVGGWGGGELLFG
jgi:heterodisulfide reductase subunit B